MSAQIADTDPAPRSDRGSPETRTERELRFYRETLADVRQRLAETRQTLAEVAAERDAYRNGAAAWRRKAEQMIERLAEALRDDRETGAGSRVRRVAAALVLSRDMAKVGGAS